MCYVETVYHLVRVSGRTIFDLDARLGRSTVSTCGIGEGRDPGEMKASVHVVTTVYHVRGVGRSRRPCIAVCLRNLLSSRPRPDPALRKPISWIPKPQLQIASPTQHDAQSMPTFQQACVPAGASHPEMSPMETNIAPLGADPDRPGLPHTLPNVEGPTIYSVALPCCPSTHSRTKDPEPLAT